VGALALLLMAATGTAWLTGGRSTDAGAELRGVPASADRGDGGGASPSAGPTAAAASPSASSSVRPSTLPSAPGTPTAAARQTAATDVPTNGTGRLRQVAVPGPQSSAAGRVVTYTVEVEQGLDVDGAQVAATVRAVLLDRRGWQQRDGLRFVSVSPEQVRAGARVDVRVTLASPGLTDRLCAPLKTGSEVSCWNRGRAVLNFRRWQLGDADSYGADVGRYRVYQINHEVGHGLGHGHKECPGKGRRAPVMVQQTIDLGGCKPWPFPSGA
jgi:hypothetical protein